MKKNILLFFLLFSLNTYSQVKDTIYINFYSGGNCTLQQYRDIEKRTVFLIKSVNDSIIFLKTIVTRDVCLNKKSFDKSHRVLKACDLLNLKIQEFTYLTENKIIYILIEKRKKYKAVKIDESSYYERGQD